MKTCKKCGSPNEDLLTRCARCGARLPRTTDAAAQPAIPGGAEPVANRMGLAILGALCFVPFGLVAILQAAQVNGLNAAGHGDRAQQAARAAGRWSLAAILTGLTLTSVLIVAARLA